MCLPAELMIPMDFTRELAIVRMFRVDDWKKDYRQYLTSDGRIKNSTSREIKEEIYNRRIKDRPFKLIEPFTQFRDKLLHKCDVCGFEWMVTPNSILDAGNGCPPCARKKSHTNMTVSNDEYVMRCRRQFNVEPLEPYITSAVPIRHRCRVCGHEWKVTAGNLKHRGCPGCRANATPTH